MEHRIVRRDVLGDRLLAAIAQEVAERGSGLDFKPVGTSYRQASIQIEVLVTTAADPTDGTDPPPEPCCVCFKVKKAYICSGDCCSDVLADEVVDVEPM